MLTTWNEAAFLFIHGFLEQAPWLRPIIAFATHPLGEAPVAAFDTILIAVTFFVLFLYYDDVPGIRVSHYTWRKVGVISLTGVIAFAASVFGKNLFLIPRPYAVLDIQPLFQLGILDSYPSGHAAFFAAVSVAVYHYHRKLGALFVLATFGIGLARIVAGVHYPVDILAGFLLGGGGAFVMALLLQDWSLRKKGIKN